MTVELLVQIEVTRSVRPKRMAKAVRRAIEHALENDVAETEVLNEDICGQISVTPLSDAPRALVFVDEIEKALSKGPKVQVPHVWVGIIEHNQGSNMYASETRDMLMLQLADYCRDQWEAEAVPESLAGLANDQIIEKYFAHVEREHVDFAEVEIQ